MFCIRFITEGKCVKERSAEVFWSLHSHSDETNSTEFPSAIFLISQWGPSEVRKKPR